MPLLRVDNISKNFGGVAALSNVNLEVGSSELLGIIGPNGAGKTTLFNVISGFLRAERGRIIYNNEEITTMRRDEISRKGIARTFQESLLYMSASCFENVFMGCHKSYKGPIWKDFLRTKSARREEESARENVLGLLQVWGLQEQTHELAGSLPYGKQRALGVCIALATNPKLLLLDEPFTGMTPTETEEMMDRVSRLPDKGISVVLVEHNMKAIMGLCQHIVVLDFGQKIAEGPPSEIVKDSKVIEAYLGKAKEYVA